MPELKYTLAGTAAFFGGYILTVITSYIVPSLLESSSDAVTYSTGTLDAIIWFGLILLWTLSMLIVPAGLIIYGVRSKPENQQDQQLFGIAFGVLYGIFALAIAYFTWSWTTPMTAVFTDTLTGSSGTFLLALFWTGYLVTWAMNVILVPYVYITDAKRGM